MKTQRITTSFLSTVLALGSTTSLSKPAFEEWRTPISCGGQQFQVVSRCKAAKEAMDLNVCDAGQRLTVAEKSIRIPTQVPSKGQAPLFAVAWSCLETPQGPVLLLDYTTGQGRSEEDEDAEFFDQNLQSIKDPTTQRKLHKALPQAKKGAVKSIMPDGGR